MVARLALFFYSINCLVCLKDVMAMKISIHWFSSIKDKFWENIMNLHKVFYSLFVFADDGEDDNEHKTDGDGDK